MNVHLAVLCILFTVIKGIELDVREVGWGPWSLRWSLRAARTLWGGPGHRWPRLSEDLKRPGATQPLALQALKETPRCQGRLTKLGEGAVWSPGCYTLLQDVTSHAKGTAMQM